MDIFVIVLVVLFFALLLQLHTYTADWWGYRGGTPPPFRPGKPALCGSCPL